MPGLSSAAARPVRGRPWMARLIAPLLRPPAMGERLFSRCANPRCSTGWMRLWRSRRAPLFEGRWACSPECMAEVVRWAVRRETGGDADSTPGHRERYAHRIPLGLMLVEQGRISAGELRAALTLQKQMGDERVKLGRWLVESGVLSETILTRALGAQWNCPVLPLGCWNPGEVASAMPRLLSEAAGAVPVRAPGGKLLYVAFCEGVDRTLGYALERMLGMRVSAGMALETEFQRAQAEYMEMPGPRTRFLEADAGPALARAIVKLIERERPAEARLVRVQDYYWLRMWKGAPGRQRLSDCDGIEDVVASIL